MVDGVRVKRGEGAVQDVRSHAIDVETTAAKCRNCALVLWAEREIDGHDNDEMERGDERCAEEMCHT